MGQWYEGTTGQRVNKRRMALWSVLALCAALILPGVASGQAVRASGAPNPPTNAHVTGVAPSGDGGWLVSIAWTPPDTTSSIAVSNGDQMFARGVGTSSDAEFIEPAGNWLCLSVAAYNSFGTSSWTPWVCAEAPGVPPVPQGVHQTLPTTSSPAFAWYAPYPTAGIVVSNGSVVTALAPGATTYAQTGVAPGYWSCLSVAAYDSSGASPWTPWACGFATPAKASGVHVSGHTPLSVSFAWTDHDPFSGITLSYGTGGTSLNPGGSTYTQSGMTTGSWVCVSILAYVTEGIEDNSGWTSWVCGQAG